MTLKALESRFHVSARSVAPPESGIVAVMNHGRQKDGLIPLWVGEGDLPTPAFICEAASRGLAAGETFYTWQRGVPELRQALADYHTALFHQPFSPERFFVTGSGMQSIHIALTITVETGDEVIVPTPEWPNFSAAVQVAGARPVEVPLSFTDGRWEIDLDRIEAAITPRSKVLFINTPANPSGWTASHDDIKAILALARKHGLWLIVDEVYTRFYYGPGNRAPSFHDVAEPTDRIIYVNTFSKNWAMTGWRVGWIEASPELGDLIENMIQYSTSGVAAFMQRAATVALKQGEGFVAHQIARARRGRELTMETLSASNRVRFAVPDGAFYAFFAVDGEPDARALAYRLVDEAGIGLAPGEAFGAGGSGYLRLCFARGEQSLAVALGRLGDWLRR
ncbi:pyridoxal phosphate-dependent aminotransferase [Segnochrobactraceae bacterium EtOH-i3]